MIPLFKVFTAKNVTEKLKPIFDSGYIGEGQASKALELAIQEKFDYQDIRLVNSATSAIDLAMHMIGVGVGDEVITTPITCTATNSPAHNRGATLVWADVDKHTGLIDIQDVGRKITERTKAIIAVNWGGNMPDYKRLKSFGMPVLEDAAHGTYWSDKERGDYVTWSFQAIKHLTTGDGGALLSPDSDRARLLRWFGLDRESSADFRCSQNIQEIGYKYHMNDINATIGLANLPHMETLITLHNANAQYYDSQLRNPAIIYKPAYSKDNPFWLYTLLVENRDRFIKYLAENGIASSLVHDRNDKHVGFHNQQYAFENAGVEYFSQHQVSIPVGWWVGVEDIQYIANTINKWRG